MAILLNEPIDMDREDELLEFRDAAIKPVAGDTAVLDRDLEPESRGFAPVRPEETRMLATARETASDDSEILDSNELTRIDGTPQKEGPFTRDLVGAYFRQMGDAGLLSRD